MSFIFILFSAYLIFAVFLDGVYVRPVITYWPGSFTVEKAQYHPGDDIYLRMVVSKYRSLTGRVNWSAVSDTGVKIGFAERNTALPSGDLDMLVKIVTLPKNISPGTWYLVGLVSFEVNPISTVTLPLSSNSFEVIEPGGT
jgi:hypothetical protein